MGDKRQKRHVSFEANTKPDEKQEEEEEKEEEQEEQEGEEDIESYQENGKISQEIGMTAFNLKDEREEGHFDANGNFVWRKEERKVQEEAWLDNISADQMDAARKARSRRAFRDELESEQMNVDKANRVLAQLLQTRETVLQALKRLGSKKRKKPSGNTRNARNRGTEAATTTNSSNNNNRPSECDKKNFDSITEAADFLMRQGEVDVYSQIKEEFEQEVKDLEKSSCSRQEEPSEVMVPASQRDQVLWEYKGADGEIHGPYPTSSILAWKQQGYFGASNAVDMRQVSTCAALQDTSLSEPNETISAADELMNDFDDDDDDKGDQEPKNSTEANSKDHFSWQPSHQIDFTQFM